MTTTEKTGAKFYQMQYTDAAGKVSVWPAVMCDKHLAESQSRSSCQIIEITESAAQGISPYGRRLYPYCNDCELRVCDVEDFIKREELDQSEYFQICSSNALYRECKTRFEREKFHLQTLRAERLAHIIVHWHRGSSEGYYVSIDREFRQQAHEDVQRCETLFTGKFWTIDEAESATNKLARLFCHYEL